MADFEFLSHTELLEGATPEQISAMLGCLDDFLENVNERRYARYRAGMR